MRWVVVEAKSLVPFHGVDRALRRSDIERDLRRMHFQREVHILLVERVEDGPPALGEIIVTLLPILLIGGWKRVNGMPDARAGEAVDDGCELGRFRRGGSTLLTTGVDELPARFCRLDHLFRGALSYS